MNAKLFIAFIQVLGYNTQCQTTTDTTIDFLTLSVKILFLIGFRVVTGQNKLSETIIN